MRVIPLTPTTSAGAVRNGLLASPSSPYSFEPHAKTRPSPGSAKAWLPPAAIDSIGGRLVTR
jgi:hypothetical protein